MYGFTFMASSYDSVMIRVGPACFLFHRDYRVIITSG